MGLSNSFRGSRIGTIFDFDVITTADDHDLSSKPEIFQFLKAKFPLTFSLRLRNGGPKA